MHNTMLIEATAAGKSIVVVSMVIAGVVAAADASNVLQGIVVAVSGWTLLEVIRQGKKLERLDQKIQDLPCDGCEDKPKKKTH